jgi:WD40 repeat protein
VLGSPARSVATGGGNGEIRFWDAETGRQRGRSLAGTPGWLLSLDFYRDGRRLVSAGSDGATRFWDVERRAPFGSPLPGFDDEHARALLVPKADRLVTVYGSGAGFVWDLAADVWKRRACSVAGRALTQREWELYLPNRSYGPAC